MVRQPKEGDSALLYQVPTNLQVSNYATTASVLIVHDFFQRHSYVFCKICGKFGRKDVLKLTHFSAHKYGPASRHGFVLNGGEPSYDKYGDFNEYQLHFGLELAPQVHSSPL
jgi:hypothetical protein